MFMFSQFKLENNFHEDENFKFVRMTFHVVLGMKWEEIWSLKIIRIKVISKDCVFKNLLQN